MEKDKIKLITRTSIAVIGALILGIFSFLNLNKFAGTMIIILGFLIGAIDPNIRDGFLSVFSLISKLFQSEENGKSINNSQNSNQQKAGRDAIINNIVNNFNGDNPIVVKSKYHQYYIDPKIRKKIKEEEALRKIRDKMIGALKIVNSAGNIGVRGRKEYKVINDTIKSFIDIKMKYQIDLDDDMINKFDEVIGALRKANDELFQNLLNNRLQQSLNGQDSFRFINKIKEADSMIKERLLRD